MDSFYKTGLCAIPYAVLVLLVGIIFSFSLPLQAAHAQNISADSVQQVSLVKEDRDGDGIADRTGDKVTVAGRATVSTSVLHGEYFRIYLQDSTAGIQLFSETYDQDRPVERGDSLVVRGEVKMYYGKPEIIVDRYEIIDADKRVPGFRPLKEALSNPKRFEGMLVEGKGIITGRELSEDNKIIELALADSASQSFDVYINDLHNLFDEFDLDRMSIGDELRIRGVFSEFIFEDTGYSALQILPRNPDDLEFSTMPRRYLAMIAIGAGAILLLVAGWIASLRSRVKSKTKLINQSLKEKETLLREIHHRVKNNLAVISGLIQLQQANVEKQEAREVLKDTESRIRSMAMIHDNLYQSHTLSDINMDEYLSNLTRSIHSTFGRQDVDLVTDIDPVSLDIDRAIPCALMVNELMTNSYKHAFKDTDDGRLTVRLKSQNGSAVLEIADNGCGLPDDFDIDQTNTLGMRLVQTFTSQLEAGMEYEQNGGTRIRIRMPLRKNERERS